jgi:ABC-2 type transport system permease protein
MTFQSPLILIALIAVVSYLSQIPCITFDFALDETGYLKDVFQDIDNTTYTNLNGLNLDALVLVKEKVHYGLLHISSVNSLDASSNNVKFYL